MLRPFSPEALLVFRATNMLRCAAVTTFSLSLLLASTTVAQATRATSKPTNPLGPPTSTQPDLEGEVKGIEQTPEQRIADLQKQLDKIRTESTHLKRVRETGGLVRIIRDRLQDRSLGGFRTIKSKLRPSTPTSHGARLMTPDELRESNGGALFTADGYPVSETDYKDLLEFVLSYADTPSDAHRMTIESLAAHVISAGQIDAPGLEAVHKRVTDARELAATGQPFFRVAEQYSDCYTATREHNGELGWLTPKDQNPMLMSALFSMKPGEKSKTPIVSEQGLHYVEVLDRIDGATPKEGQVRVQHTLAMYTPRSIAIGKRVRSGKVDLAFRDKELLSHMSKLPRRRQSVPASKPTSSGPTKKAGVYDRR